jgi:hypothetical protein
MAVYRVYIGIYININTYVVFIVALCKPAFIIFHSNVLINFGLEIF